MGSKRRSAIWLISTDELQTILNESFTIKEVIGKLGYEDPAQGAHNRRLHQRIKEDNLDTTQFEINCKKWREDFNKSVYSKRAHSLEDCLVENCKINRDIVKKKIIQNNTIPYKCSECGIADEWNGKPISLQLDHINGVNDDNRIENLRFLCPNCHSQTHTFGSRNKKA